MRSLTVLDATVVVLYLMAVAFIGYRMSRRQKTTAEFFVANRALPGWAVAFSIVGTVISSVSFVAFPGAAFSRDWRLLVPNLTVPLVLVFVTIFIVPFYRRVVRMSSYEYLERRFGVGARLYCSAGFVVLRTVDLGFTLLLTAIAVEVITGWNIQAVIAGIVVFTLLYTLLGGIEAVVWNDVLQGLVLASGALTILFTILFGGPGSAQDVVDTAWRGGKFGLGDFTVSWGSLFGEHPTFWMFAITGLAHFGRSYLVEQNMVQRYLVARTDREAQRATFTGALSCLVIWVTFTFIGSALWGHYQLAGNTLPAEVVSQPDNILPYFIATVLPSGLVGLILAAILAAAMQSFSADLTSVATVITEDYYARFVPSSSDARRLLIGRIGLTVIGLVAAGVALQLTSSRTRAVYEIFVTLASIVAGGVLGLFALGFLTRRGTKKGAYTGLTICVLFVAWATITGPLKVNLGINYTMHPLMIGLISHVLLFGTGYIASMFWKDAEDKVDGLTIWSKNGEAAR
ncbi:MAG: sodium/solute symporter [Bryobacterales bacterium]|nr:sodium/solute symporter [Bryobacterales bacterium]